MSSLAMDLVFMRNLLLYYCCGLSSHQCMCFRIGTVWWAYHDDNNNSFMLYHINRKLKTCRGSKRQVWVLIFHKALHSSLSQVRENCMYLNIFKTAYCEYISHKSLPFMWVLYWRRRANEKRATMFLPSGVWSLLMVEESMRLRG